MNIGGPFSLHCLVLKYSVTVSDHDFLVLLLLGCVSKFLRAGSA